MTPHPNTIMAPVGEDDAPFVSEEEYADAVTRHAKYLGIDPEIDAAYMWIAEEVGCSQVASDENHVGGLSVM